MAKFYDVVGYVEAAEETSPGIWEERIIERRYYGDEARVSRRWDTWEKVNDKLNVNLQISVMADTYAFEHAAAIRYVRWNGALWEVTAVEPQRPRLLLTIGGAYDGPVPA